MSIRFVMATLVICLFPAALFASGGSGEPQASTPEPQAPQGGAVMSARLTSAELARMIAEKPDSFLLIDVRTPEEFKGGAIPKAINIPYDRLRDQPPATDRSARIVVYCQSGRRSAIAAQTLAEMGYTNVTDFGGISRWEGKRVSRP